MRRRIDNRDDDLANITKGLKTNKIPIVVYKPERNEWVVEFHDEKNLPITVELTVTPALARDILENHRGRNRRIVPKRVRKYAREMLNDQWMGRETNDLGLIDRDGLLMNGQHRVAAVIEYNKTIIMSFRFGGQKKYNNDCGRGWEKILS